MGMKNYLKKHMSVVENIIDYNLIKMKMYELILNI